MIIFYLFSFNLVYSQGVPGNSFNLENCFQTVDMFSHQGSPASMLRGSFWLRPDGIHDYLYYVSFSPRDNEGNILPFDYVSIEDVENSFTLDLIPVAYELIQVGRNWTILSGDDLFAFRIQNQNGWFTNNLSFPSGTKTVNIKLYNYFQEANAYTELTNFWVTLIDDFNPLKNIANIQTYNECEEFDDFNINVTYEYLFDLYTGFCGEFNYKLKRNPQNISDPNGLNDLPLYLGASNDLTSISENCEDCDLMAVPYGVSNYPVPCGCETFDLEITIEPCPDRPNPPCDETFTVIISDGIEICCKCDIRDSAPPGF